jgi:hypothetical protein
MREVRRTDARCGVRDHAARHRTRASAGGIGSAAPTHLGLPAHGRPAAGLVVRLSRPAAGLVVRLTHALPRMTPCAQRTAAFTPAPPTSRKRPRDSVLATKHKLWAEIVPKLAAQQTPPSAAAPVQLTLLGVGQCIASAEAVDGSAWTGHAEAPPPTRHPWSLLTRHVFSVDINLCEKCGAQTRVVGFATTPRAIERALQRAGLAAQPPPASGCQRVADTQLVLSFG